MTDETVSGEAASDDGQLAAGAFSDWLAAARGALRGERGSDVPCGSCTACCASSQFVHVAPDETDALAHIPAALLFPAPGRPPGHVLLGYDEHGRCPMLADDGCSVYEHRPRACRTYDCRVFPAAGIEPDGGDQHAIAERTRRWRFEHPTEHDRIEHESVRAAARFLADHAGELPRGIAPVTATQRAVLAVKLYQVFVAVDPVAGWRAVPSPAPDAVRAAAALLADGEHDVDRRPE